MGCVGAGACIVCGLRVWRGDPLGDPLGAACGGAAVVGTGGGNRCSSGGAVVPFTTRKIKNGLASLPLEDLPIEKARKWGCSLLTG